MNSCFQTDVAHVFKKLKEKQNENIDVQVLLMYNAMRIVIRSVA
jgi:hypothetical protein